MFVIKSKGGAEFLPRLLHTSFNPKKVTNNRWMMFILGLFFRCSQTNSTITNGDVNFFFTEATCGVEGGGRPFGFLCSYNWLHVVCNVWFQYLYQLSDMGRGNDTQIHQWVIWDGKPPPRQNSAPHPPLPPPSMLIMVQKTLLLTRAGWMWALPHWRVCFWWLHHHHFTKVEVIWNFSFWWMTFELINQSPRNQTVMQTCLLRVAIWTYAI